MKLFFAWNCPTHPTWACHLSICLDIGSSNPRISAKILPFQFLPVRGPSYVYQGAGETSRKREREREREMKEGKERKETKRKEKKRHEKRRKTARRQAGKQAGKQASKQGRKKERRERERQRYTHLERESER